MKFYVSDGPRTLPRSVLLDLCDQLGVDANRVESIDLRGQEAVVRVVGRSDDGLIDPTVFVELTYRITD